MNQKGYVPALGTPLDAEGNFMPESMAAHVESQLAAGASALLCMGSMGQQPYISNTQAPLAARTCVDTVKKSIPIYVGVSDVSVRRIADRIEALRGLTIDGIVSTASFYYALSQAEIIGFYRRIADLSPYPLYLYDLPGVTQVPFTCDTVLTLMSHPNIRGIKSDNIKMLRKIMRNPSFDPKFKIFFSGLDIMDVGASYGLPYMLDGMFSCTPATSLRFGRYLSSGNVAGVGEALDKILLLRNTMARFSIFPSFTYVMNRLGFPGKFHPDYIGELQGTGQEVLDGCLVELGEIQER